MGVDVESLYTLIPYRCGLRAVEETLHLHYQGCGHQNEFIMELLEFALENNCFQFLSTFYQQTKGTSMGGILGPSVHLPASGLVGGVGTCKADVS